MPKALRAATAALVITLLLAAAKVAMWAATGSLAVLSQALDSVVDVIALGLVLVALRIASKPPDTSHHFGHTKAEHLAAFAETLLLAGVIVVVGAQAIERLLFDAPQVDASYAAMGLLAVSGVVDAARAAILVRATRTYASDALRAGAINVFADVGTAAVALVSLVAVRQGLNGADSAGALIVGLMVAAAAVPIARRSVDVLMDRAPAELEDEIARAASAATGVAETRRVRVRGGGGGIFADVVVAAGRTASLERAHDIAEDVENAVKSAIPGIDLVVHVEPAGETGGLVERAQAAASKADGVHEIHNVSVHEFTEGGTSKLHATLHAKGSPDMSISEAHDLADRIEEAVRDELGHDARVDTHIEPLESAYSGTDVTRDEKALVTLVQRIAEQEPELIDCHEVLVTSTRAGLAVVAHVRAPSSLPLQRIHQASQRIETAVHNERNDVASVLLHFEPG